MLIDTCLLTNSDYQLGTSLQLLTLDTNFDKYHTGNIFQHISPSSKEIYFFFLLNSDKCASKRLSVTDVCWTHILYLALSFPFGNKKTMCKYHHCSLDTCALPLHFGNNFYEKKAILCKIQNSSFDLEISTNILQSSKGLKHWL